MPQWSRVRRERREREDEEGREECGREQYPDVKESIPN
jgi:hypothetical protein